MMGKTLALFISFLIEGVSKEPEKPSLRDSVLTHMLGTLDFPFISSHVPVCNLLKLWKEYFQFGLGSTGLNLNF